MVIIPVGAHLLTLTISTPEIVEHPVRVGRETHMQRERIQRTREIKSIRSAASLISNFGCGIPHPIPLRRRRDPKTSTMRVSSC